MDEHKEDQIIKWAMGRLSPSETEALEREFEVDPDLKAYAMEIKETVGLISLALPPAERPVGLAHKILRVEKRKRSPAALVPWASDSFCLSA